MSGNISRNKLGEISYKRDIENKSYRINKLDEGEVIQKDKTEYLTDFFRDINPIIQKYKIADKKYSIPTEDVECLLLIYDLYKDVNKVIRKIYNKKYVSAKELKREVDSLNLTKHQKEKLLNFFEYEVRIKADEIQENMLENLKNSIDYILAPNNNQWSDTKDPILLSRQLKKEFKEETISIEDKVRILEYINSKHNEFTVNLLCLVNDIALTRSEETNDKESIDTLISRLSYWE